jgi:hypothetical protein
MISLIGRLSLMIFKSDKLFKSDRSFKSDKLNKIYNNYMRNYVRIYM